MKLCRFVKPVPSVFTLNTVPLPELPPATAVPYSVLLDKSNSATGLAPSLMPIKLCRFVKYVPPVLMANTVPLCALPPYLAVPYRVLPDKINREFGETPSLLKLLVSTAVKLCRVVKVCAVTLPVGIKLRATISVGRRNRLFLLVFIG